MRRYTAPVYGNRFLGNTNTTEVHDLDNEKMGPSECQISEIINAGNARLFSPNTLQQANSLGYDNCHYCIGGSTR